MDIVELRKRALALLSGAHDSIPAADVSFLLQELEIHQIELELQNAELQSAQAEIESLRQRYYDLYMFAPVGYLVVDQNGQIEDVNLAACQLLGKERRYVIGRPLSKYFQPQSRSDFFELLNTVFEVEVPKRAEFVLTSQLGNKQTLHVAAIIQTFREGHRYLARLAITDISEHVTAAERAREALKQNDFTLGGVQVMAHVGVWTWDALANTMIWSDEMHRIFGVSRDTFAGNPAAIMDQAVHPEDRERVRAYYTSDVDGQKPLGIEYRVIRPDGTIRHVWAQSGETTIDVDGKIVKVSGIVQDITDRKRSETRLEEVERIADSALDALSASIAILDEQGTILTVNKAWTRFAEQNGGSPATTGIGVNYLAALHAVAPDDESYDLVRDLLEGIRRVTHHELDAFELEYPCHAPHEQRWFVVRVTRFDAARPTRIVMAHENITERIQSTQALERQKSELNGRIQELNVLHQHARLLERELSLEELYRGTVYLIPAAWQHREITCARLTIDDHQYATTGFIETDYAYAAPIVIDEQAIGQLEVFHLDKQTNATTDAFTEHERYFIDELAHRLGRKIKERRDAERQRLEAETQAVILRLVSGDTPDQEAFIALVLEEAVKLTESSTGYFHFVNQGAVSRSPFTWPRESGDAYRPAPHLYAPLEQAGAWADSVRTHQPVIINDYPGGEIPDGQLPVNRYLGVPIMQGDVPVAVLGVANKPQDYTDLDVVRLTLMSASLWTWIERKRASTAIRQQNDEIRAINRAISISTSSLDSEAVARIACGELAQLLDAVSVVLALRTETSGDYQVTAAVEDGAIDETRVGTLLVPAGDPILASLEQNGIPQVANATSPGAGKRFALPACKPDSLIIPVTLRASLVGLFCLSFKPGHVFSDNEVGHAANIVQVISQALENSWLHQKIAKQNEQLSLIVDERTAELRRTYERLQIVLDNVSNPILLVDAAGKIDITNTAFNRKLGYETDELRGSPVIKLFGPEKRTEIGVLLALVREQKQTKPVEAKVIAKDGAFLDVEVAFGFVEGSSGQIVCTLYDISHIKEVERIKDQFVSMVSHELRTPIASLLLSSNSVEQYYDRMSDEQKHVKLIQINQRAQLLSELVTSILDTSRLAARQGQRGQDSINVGKILLDVVEEFRERTAQKQQMIDVQIVSTQVSIPGEKSDFVRIWRNLLSNAVKYTQDGGYITVRLIGGDLPEDYRLPDLSGFDETLPADLNSGRYLIGIVEDNGHGIRAEDMPQLFTRFFRGWAAGTSITGTGLGLSLVRELLQLYGGDITVRSTLGMGTTFCFWLPIEDAVSDPEL